MGRLAAYLGPKTEIATLVEGGSYSLIRQASECPDGFGLGWYPEDENPEPVNIISENPIWNSGHLLQIPRRYTSSCVVAGVRKAGQGPVDISGVQPFRSGKYLFQHVGELDRFREVFQRPLAKSLSDERYQSLQGHSASELLFALWLDALGDGEGPEAMATALEQVIGRVQDLAATHDASASFAMVITDGSCLVTLRSATHGPPPALYTIVAGDNAPLPATGRIVASEPLFPGSWSALDPHSLVIFTIEPEKAE